MPIIVNSKHAPGRSIQDIYTDLINESSNVVNIEMANGMLKFIDMLNSIFPTTRIWALTSMYKLVLQTEDDWKSDWLVRIGCLGNEYNIEYLVPENRRPWPYAYVHGVARGLDEAKKYLLIAMKECGAWEGNPELMIALET